MSALLCLQQYLRYNGSVIENLYAALKLMAASLKGVAGRMSNLQACWILDQAIEYPVPFHPLDGLSDQYWELRLGANGFKGCSRSPTSVLG